VVAVLDPLSVAVFVALLLLAAAAVLVVVDGTGAVVLVPTAATDISCSSS
jgi:hypothetical protein